MRKNSRIATIYFGTSEEAHRFAKKNGGKVEHNFHFTKWWVTLYN